MNKLIILFSISIIIISCYVPEMIIDSKEYRKYRDAITHLDIGDNFYYIVSKRGIIIRTKDDFLYFRQSSYTLDRKYLNVLENIKVLLAENKNVKIVVEGHSDFSGGEGAIFDNVILSKKRSEVVIKKLIDIGVDKSKLISRYYSDYMPYYTNNSYDYNRSIRNRRVEFVFIGDDKYWENYKNATEEVFSKVLELEKLINN